MGCTTQTSATEPTFKDVKITDTKLYTQFSEGGQAETTPLVNTSTTAVKTDIQTELDVL